MGAKVLFLANHFITLFSFRKELIEELINTGNEVFLSLPNDPDNKYFEDLGCKVLPTSVDRRGVNPINDVKLIFSYKRLIANVNPDIIFSYTIKPNIYGALACNGKYKQICNITGTGGTFLRRNFVGEMVKILYRISITKCYKVFFQNTGDRDFFIKNKMVRNNYDILPGSGCDLDSHRFLPMPEGEIMRFLFIGRVMKLKGIDEYLKAAQIIKAKYSNTEFIIAGWNEEAKYKEVVAKYQEQGIVNYIGFRKDICDWIAKVHCVILPSHGGEGVPNVLLESAAIGRACIGSRINGTKDVIEEDLTGYLFSPGDVVGLVDKIERFVLLTPEQRAEMGKAGRKKIEKEFNRRIVIDKYVNELNKVSN